MIERDPAITSPSVLGWILSGPMDSHGLVKRLPRTKSSQKAEAVIKMHKMWWDHNLTQGGDALPWMVNLQPIHCSSSRSMGCKPYLCTSLGKGDKYLLSCAGVRKKSPIWFSFSGLITLKPAFFVLILELCSFETLKLIFFLNIQNIKSTRGSGANSLWKISSFCTPPRITWVLTTKERPLLFQPNGWSQGWEWNLLWQSPLVVWH